MPTVSEDILKAIKTLAFIIIFWYFALWGLIFYGLIWIYNYKIKYPEPWLKKAELSVSFMSLDSYLVFLLKKQQLYFQNY